jgi:two-component system, OmpR family, sensor kinase
MKTKPWHRRSLAYRLYAIGLLQLFVVVLAAVAIFFVVVRTAPRIEANDIKRRLVPVIDDPAALDREVRVIRDEERVDVSVYDDARRLIASNVDPPLRPPPFSAPNFVAGDVPHPFPYETPPNRPPPTEDQGRRMEPPPWLMLVELDGRAGTFLAIARLPRRPTPWLPILTLLSGVVVVSVGAVLTARFLTTPLGRVSRAVKAFGDGDLNARAHLQRDDELGTLGNAFDRMAEQIRTLLHAEKELLANVAHELRTPLSRIRVALEIATEGDAETARASLVEIGTDLSELETLLADVLTAAQLELAAGNARSAGFMIHRETLSPAWLVERATERFRSRFPSRPLDVSIQDDLPNVEADPVLFRRVLDNLLENSHKYTPDPSAVIAIAATATDGGVLFGVRDFGSGIPESDLPRLFQAFYRGEKSRSRMTGGVGLGLTLAQRVVEAHDGTIEVASSLGAGTTVRVFLPIRPEGQVAAG